MSGQESKIVRFFRKIGDAILNLKKLPSKLKETKSSYKIKKREIPSFLQSFMENRDAGWPEYVMLKAQLVIISLFGAAVVLSFSWISPLILAPVVAGLIGYLTYLTPTELKLAFWRDYPAYRTFIVLSIAISLAIIFLRKILITNLPLMVSSPYQALTPILLILGAVFFTFIGFRIKYGRNYTYGTVTEVRNNKAAVKINYDIKSNVKNGIFLLESLPNVQPGDEVKVSVDRSMLGLKGSEPTTILEKT